MANISLDNKASLALSKLQDTNLSPMEEALFQAWSKANEIKKPDAPDNTVDLRGIYKVTGGTVLPNGELRRIAEKMNAQNSLQGVLHQRMMDHINKTIESAKGKQDQFHSEQRQDLNHQQKMEASRLELQKAPHEARMRGMDLQKQQMDLHGQNLDNQGKQIDLAKAIIAPEGQYNASASVGTSAIKPTSNKL